jgi:PhzF family phenazine biosynthesis protein
MMKKRYDKIGELYRLRAFPKTSNGGNKAGVFINGYNLTETDMQTIAKRVNYSETAFVLKSDLADFKVRFFTPNSEVDLCGHATIATFNLLRDLKIISPGIYTQETKAGILKLDVRNDFVFMEQPEPKYYDLVDNDLIRRCFKKIDFDERFKPQIVSTGIKELFIAVKSIEELNALTPDFGAISTLARTYSAIGIHAFALGEDADAYGRNFAPVVGIDEESATGTSNGALACYLYKYWKKKNNYVLRQGYSMNQPSEIIVNLEIENESVKKVHVGGSAIIINQ